MFDLTKRKKVVNRGARHRPDDIFHSCSNVILINSLVVEPRQRGPSVPVAELLCPV